MRYSRWTDLTAAEKSSTFNRLAKSQRSSFSNAARRAAMGAAMLIIGAAVDGLSGFADDAHCREWFGRTIQSLQMAQMGLLPDTSFIKDGELFNSAQHAIELAVSQVGGSAAATAAIGAGNAFQKLAEKAYDNCGAAYKQAQQDEQDKLNDEEEWEAYLNDIIDGD